MPDTTTSQSLSFNRAAVVLELNYSPIALLRKCGSGFRFDQRHINRVDKAVDINVFAEVRIRDCVAGLRLRLTNINSIREAIGVGVAKKHVHAHGRDISTVTGRITYPMKRDADMRDIRNTGEIDNVIVRVSSDTATNLILRNRLRSAAGVGSGGDAGGTRTGQRIKEGED